MDKEHTKDQIGNKIVTAVGNSWIVCRSKSHSGRIYYFNTLTGEAAWNLSEAEIEKAKRRTKVLESQSGLHIEGCSEPKEPPLDHFHHCISYNNTAHMSQRTIPSKICNNEVPSNQFPKEPLTVSSFVSSQYGNFSQLNTLNQLGLSIPAAAGYNPNVWSVPPTHQIFIAPSVAHLAPRNETSVNVSNNLENNRPLQNTSVTLSNRFKIINDLECKRPKHMQGNRKFSPWTRSNSYEYKRGGFFQRRFHNTANRDLRQVLSSKKQVLNHNDLRQTLCKNVEDCDTVDSREQFLIETDERLQNRNTGALNKEELFLRQADDEWLEKNLHVQGTKLVLDLTPLRNLSDPKANSDLWYIVADKDILLNNLNFLSVLMNSDEQCMLMVPRRIMTELRAMSDTPTQLTSRARRATCFILGQIEAGYAFIYEHSVKTADGNSCILNTCNYLQQQNYHVILISNDQELQQYINSRYIFTVKKIKDLLSKKSIEKATASLEHIKIIIPNNPTSDNLCVENIKTFQETQSKIGMLPKDVCGRNEIQKDDIPTSLNKEDAGVQTDFNVLQLSETTNTDKDTSLNTVIKRREIRLRRNTINQTTNTDNNSVEKKNFKWRRRRRVANTQTVEGNSFVSGNSNINVNRTAYPESEIIPEEKYNEEDINSEKRLPSPKLIESLCNTIDDSVYNDEIVESSESNASIIMRKNQIENITIEESTSTSDIISNTASNVDSESAHSIIQPKLGISNNKNELHHKKFMFEVTSAVMEECLTVRCDEWVSRFVQIMEEVLAQILHKEPKYLHPAMPPPWTLHEATECIKKKFSKDDSIVYAANKLSDVLFKISDDKGKISVNLSPAEYMDMYTHGVYLVHTIQSVMNNCEDLQTAADSLSKLLNEIQNPKDGHTMFIDSVADNKHAFLENVSRTINTNINNKREAADNTKSIQKSQNEKEQNLSCDNKKPRKYNLRSNQRTLGQAKIEAEQNVSSIKEVNAKSAFFTNLNLQKKNNETKSDATEQQIFTTDLQNPSNDSNESSMRLNLDTNKNDDREDTYEQSKNEPTIIRKFNKCLEFEKRLKNKITDQLYLDEFDYGIDYLDRYYDEDNGDEDTEYEDDVEIDKADSGDNASQFNETDNCKIDSNNNFDQFIVTMLNEIKEAFLQVHKFCNKTHALFNDSLSNSVKNEIKEKAEKAHLHMNNLHKTLHSIFDRETNDFENNIQAKLRQAGISDLVPNDEQCFKYKDVVSKCVSQANILLESLDFILNAVKS